MSGFTDHWSGHDRVYGHGIICNECIARNCSEEGQAVRSVTVGTFVQVLSVRENELLFRIVNEDMQVEQNRWVCKKVDVVRVPENLWGPLFPVKRTSRLGLLEDTKTAEALGNISVGHTVQVLRSDGTVACIATVAFKNSIERLGTGVFFGLRVLNPRDHLEGIIKKVSLLEPGTKGFPRGCDLVVTIERIHPSKPSYNKSKSIHYYEKENKKELNNLPIGEDVNNMNFKSMILLNLKDKFGNPIKKPELKGTDSNIKKISNSDDSGARGDYYFESEISDKELYRSTGHRKNSTKDELDSGNLYSSKTGLMERSESQSNVIVSPSTLIKFYDHKVNNTKEHVQAKNNNESGGNNNNNNNITVFNNNINYNNNNNMCGDSNENNNYYNNLKSSHFCCEGRHEQTVRSSANLHSKNFEDTFLDLSKGDFNSDPFQSRYSCKNVDCKQVLSTGFPKNCGSKSFDLGKPSDRKFHYRRHFNSVDSELLQNPTAVPQKAVAQDGYGMIGPNRLKSRDVHDSCVEKKSHVDPEFWDCRWSERSNSDENLAPYYDSPKVVSQKAPCERAEELGKGSVVELTLKGEPRYGVIRWLGTLPDDDDASPPRLVAGIEMDEEMDGFTDGTFNNRRYFQCNARKALFVPLSKCRKDSRFSDEVQKQSFSSKANYGQIDCPAVEGTVPPVNRKGDIESLCGKNRGIQGHHNSCYLDATLFSMFAFTSVFDSLLYRPPTKDDIPQYCEVQRVLREEIVNPLRKNLYVRADRVMKLRTLLDKLSSVSGLTSEEKDPEEFLNSLLAQILKAEPFLKLNSGQEAFHYQLFVEKDERLSFPSVQQLFEQSFVASDIKLKQIPSCLIIQMPRFGKSFKMYSKILPPQLLDITDIIENSPRQCTVCGKLAEYECKDCFGQNGIGSGLESISFCKTCLETAHNHHCRTRHVYRSLTVPEEFYELKEHCIIPRLYLELFAVVCIETSHYVAFVKCGSGSDAPWCFFDSMADRKGEQNGYNIPKMVPCPDLPFWLSEDGAKMLNEMEDERQLPEHAKRLFSDAYMCMYQSPDLMMYR